MSVSCECCVLASRILCVGLITRPWGVLPSVVCLSVIVKPQQLGGPNPLGDRRAMEKQVQDVQLQSLVVFKDSIQRARHVSTYS